MMCLYGQSFHQLDHCCRAMDLYAPKTCMSITLYHHVTKSERETFVAGEDADPLSGD